MRIGVVGFSSLGGSGVIATELAAGLAARGHEVHLFAPERPVRPLRSEEGLHFHAVEAPAYPALREPPFALALASKLIEVSRERGLELLNVHYAVPHAVSALLAVRALGDAGPRTVVSLHGTDVTRVGADPAYLPITSVAIDAADAITVPSRFLREEATRTFELSRAIEVVPNFVDIDRFRPGERDVALLRGFFPNMEETDLLLVHVSNFRPVKRPLDLMEVLARLRKELPVRMLLVGDGPERDRTEARAHELGLQDFVRFLGARPDFASILRQADLFLLTSEMESFCLAALEALSSGVPVAGYRVGGIPEVVTEEVGSLVEAFDVEALARAAAAILTSPDRKEMARRGRERAERHFRRDPAIERYESLFARVSKERR